MSLDPTDLLAHEEQAREADKMQRAKLAEMRDDIRWLMGHAQGRRLVWWLLSLAGVYRSTFVVGDGGRTTAFNEGKRALGLMLLDEVMTHAPASHGKMTEEAAKGAVVD